MHLTPPASLHGVPNQLNLFWCIAPRPQYSPTSPCHDRHWPPNRLTRGVVRLHALLPGQRLEAVERQLDVPVGHTRGEGGADEGCRYR